MPISDQWKKSSRSGSSGSCVEVRLINGTVEVRDTKLGEDSPILPFTASQWAAFAAEVQVGRHDLA